MAKYLLKCPKCRKEREYEPFNELPRARARVRCPHCKLTMGIKNNIVKLL